VTQENADVGGQGEARASTYDRAGRPQQFGTQPAMRALGGITVANNQSDRAVSPLGVERLDYTVPRLTVPVPDAVEFTRRYEAAVPDLPFDAVRELVARRAPWSEMKRLIGGAAPFGFLIYFRNNVGSVMQLAGDKSRCTAYLMGNHLIAERMFRFDPRAMMYAPLHTVIWEDHEGKAWFTIDQPSAQFGSFGIPKVTKVGLELDHKVAALLEALSVPVPDALR
jgi:hypothetical protein